VAWWSPRRPSPPSATSAPSDGDAAILESAIGLEQIAVFAYQAAIDSDLLEDGVVGVAELFRDQEQEHADGLITALESMGGTAPEPPTSVEDVDAAVPGLGDVESQEDVIRFAIELETAAVAAYYDAHQKLEDAALLQTGASIMANEGQHLVVLRQAVGENPSPAAFATGEA
jgi:rubrerythrin